jgi:hypothetical protein
MLTFQRDKCVSKRVDDFLKIHAKYIPVLSDRERFHKLISQRAQVLTGLVK